MKPVPILMYHSISREAAPRFIKFTLPPEVFDAQMSHLRSEGYTPLTVAQFAAALRSAEPALPARPVVITFDDGFADFHAHALPCLQKYGFPASLYIVTGHVGDTSRWLKAEREEKRLMLTWSQAAEIAAAGIECGAHTVTHADLDVVDREKAREEIARSRDMLEQRLARPVLTFAYPFGHFDPTVREMVIQAGYAGACAVKHAMSHDADDPFALARITVTRQTTLAQFAGLLAGKGLAPATRREPLRVTGWRLVRRVSRGMTSRY